MGMCRDAHRRRADRPKIVGSTDDPALVRTALALCGRLNGGGPDGGGGKAALVFSALEGRYRASAVGVYGGRVPRISALILACRAAWERALWLVRHSLRSAVSKMAVRRTWSMMSKLLGKTSNSALTGPMCGGKKAAMVRERGGSVEEEGAAVSQTQGG